MGLDTPRLDSLRSAAATQHGLLLARRLREFGLTEGRLRGLRQQGWIADVRRGVVLVGGGAPTEWQKAVAAWMAAGEPAALSHSTAARIHRLYCAGAFGGAPSIELSIPRPAHPRLAGCTVHRVGALGERDVVGHRGVRVTSPLRTLLDVAPALFPTVLAKTVDEGLIARMWTTDDLVGAVSSRDHHRGVMRLRRVMAARSDDRPEDTPLEQRAARALRSFGPFETGYQVIVEGRLFIFDLAWPRYKVGVECDGWTPHGRTRSKFDGDRRRNNLLASHGWTVVHLTSAMTADEMREAVVKVLLRAAAAG